MADLPAAGALIVTGGRLGQVVAPGRVGSADGVWIIAPTSDPGSITEHPVFAQAVRLAQLDVTVCQQPWPTHGCGLAHLRPVELATLTRAAA